MDYRRTLPFYMNYQNAGKPYYGMYGQQPNYRGYTGMDMPMGNIPLRSFQENMSEEEAMQDLDYLQEMYPADVKNYQRKIADILDKMDYQGSLIYDAYPDRSSLVRLADQIVDILKQDEPDSTSPEKWEWLGDLILILLFYEIYRRRRMNRRSFHNF